MTATIYRWTGETYGPTGYERKDFYVRGPLYHGSRSRRLGPGDMLTAGQRTNPWGDEGVRSRFVHFTTNLHTAAAYAEQAGGAVYEVVPTGDFRQGYDGNEYKSEHPLRVVRKITAKELKDA